MNDSEKTNGLLQTLVQQVTDLAGRTATKEDITQLRHAVDSGLEKVHERVDGITTRLDKQVLKCTDLHNQFGSTIERLQKQASDKNSVESEKRKTKADFRSKIILAIIVAVLTLLSTIVAGQLQKHGIVFTK